MSRWLDLARSGSLPLAKSAKSAKSPQDETENQPFGPFGPFGTEGEQEPPIVLPTVEPAAIPANSLIEEPVRNQGELPLSTTRWDALPRYLLAELERTGLLDRDTSERVVRTVWHNSTACGQRRKEFKA